MDAGAHGGVGNTNRRAEAGRRTREVAERAATPKGAALCGFVGPLMGVCAHTQNMYVLRARVFVCAFRHPQLVNWFAVLITVEHLKPAGLDQPAHGFNQNGLVYPHFLGFRRFRNQFGGKINASLVTKALPALLQLRHYLEEYGLGALDSSLKRRWIVPRPLPGGHDANVVAIGND